MRFFTKALAVLGSACLATAQTADNPRTRQPAAPGKGVLIKHGEQKPAPKQPTTSPRTPPAASQSGSQLLASTGSDSCTTPDVLSGTGTFPVDTQSATTGLEGQSEGICTFFGLQAINIDVWFTWNAPASGVTTISICDNGLGGGTLEDTKIAVYPGTGCPTAGSALACNDDGCAPGIGQFASTLSFIATAGQDYVFQFGNYPGGGTFPYTATFELQQPSLLPEDDCSTAAVLAGPGPYPVDTTGATTGTQGQTEAICDPNGVSGAGPGIERDTWHEWTAVTGGVATVSLCGQIGGGDSRVAIYAGAGCPAPGTALACDDDTCAGFTSTVSFNSVAGNVYMIQIGSFPTAPSFTGTFTIFESPPASNDDCSTPLTVVAGAGPYSHDNTLATTGTQGQGEALCNFFGTTAVDRDLWYEWTAPAGGFFRLTMCGFSGADTKVAVYAAGGCPTPGSALSCNDDDCAPALQSRAIWAATGGTTYLLQIGNYISTAPVAGAFDILPIVLTPGDDCSAPVAIAGPGPHAFDNSSASTGSDGQNSAACDFFGLTGVVSDLWFCWTAPSSGKFELSTLAQTIVDTKVAVYDGCGCPVTQALACSDDACNSFQGALAFDAVAGSTYSIQIGSFPGVGGSTGAGTFTIQPSVTPTAGCALDDGLADNQLRSLTPVTGWIQRFGQLGVLTGVVDIQVVWGGGGGINMVNGAPAEVLLFDDPNEDGDPADAVLIDQVPVLTASVDTDGYNIVTLPIPRVLNGYFFVGAALQHPGSAFPAPVDEDSCVLDTPNRSWLLGDGSGVLNYASLPANSVYMPIDLATDVTGSCLMIRAGCSTSPGVEFCSNGTLGIDHLTGCPCGNAGTDPFAGCAHSFSTAGARLGASGLTQLDTLPNTTGQVVLRSTNSPAAAFTLFLQHPTIGDQIFHDGVICVQSAGLVRLRGRNAGVSQGQPAGQAIFPNNAFANDATLTLSIRGGVIPGSGATRYYSGFYRNASTTFCPPATANVTNGLEIVW